MAAASLKGSADATEQGGDHGEQKRERDPAPEENQHQNHSRIVGAGSPPSISTAERHAVVGPRAPIGLIGAMGRRSGLAVTSGGGRDS